MDIERARREPFAVPDGTVPGRVPASWGLDCDRIMALMARERKPA
jgi:hypothetical protein